MAETEKEHDDLQRRLDRLREIMRAEPETAESQEPKLPARGARKPDLEEYDTWSEKRLDMTTVVL